MRIFIENCTLFPALLHHPPSLPTSLATCSLIAHIHLHARPRHCQSGANCNSCHHTLHTFPHSSHSALYSHCTLHTALHTLLSPSPASTDTFCSIVAFSTHIYCCVTCSLQSILARSLLNAGRRFAGLLWHIALLFEYVPNAVRDALVPREGEYHTYTYEYVRTTCCRQQRKNVIRNWFCVQLFTFDVVAFFPRVRDRDGVESSPPPWLFPQAVNKLTYPYTHALPSDPPCPFCLWWVMKLPAGRQSS